MKLLEGKGKIKEYINNYNLELYETKDYSEAVKSIKNLRKYKSISVDIETTGFDFWKEDMIGLGIAVSDSLAIYIVTRDFTDKQIKNLIELFNENTREVYMWNAYFDKSFTLGRYEVGLNFTHDGLIYAHTMFNHIKLKGKGLGLKDFTNYFLPFKNYEDELEEEKSKIIKERGILTAEFHYGMFSDETLAPYGCMDVISTQILTNNLRHEADRKYKEAWDKLKGLIKLKHDVTEVYIKAKIRGMKIDRDKILELTNEWKAKLKPLYKKLNSKEEIKELIKQQGKEFNPRSSKQKIKLLFDICGFEVVETTDTGNPSTAAYTIETILKPYKDVEFEDLPSRIQVVRLIDDIRLYEKGINSFLGTGSGKGKNGLWTLTEEDYPYVHSNHNITGTITGRTSTSHPNLAQVPSARSILGKIKQCYVPHEDYRFVSFDYASAELRVIAYYSQEKTFLEAFDKGLNLHSMLALRIFGDKMDIPKELTEKEKCGLVKEKYNNTWRAKVKSVNFSLSYGTTKYGIAKNLNISVPEAEDFLDIYKQNNPRLIQFIEDNKKFAHFNGYVEDYMGQRLYLDLMKYFDLSHGAYNEYEVEKQCRKTTNFRIQASNASILYNCMVGFFKEVEERGLDIHLIATIYDSVKLEVHKDIPDKLVFNLLKKHFEVDIGNVTLEIDLEKADVGDSWFEVNEI